jgi:hypothetical protein
VQPKANGYLTLISQHLLKNKYKKLGGKNKKKGEKTKEIKTIPCISHKDNFVNVHSSYFINFTGKEAFLSSLIRTHS